MFFVLRIQVKHFFRENSPSFRLLPKNICLFYLLIRSINLFVIFDSQPKVDDSDDSSIKEESNDSGILLITTKSPVVANSLKPCSETLSTSERALVNAEQDSLTDESSSSSVEVLDAPVDSRVLC